jgi:excinuclease UvrABC nuclease subunit
MKSFKWVHPYNEKDKPAIKSSWGKSGVYIIKQNGKIVYVGRSGYNLYKTMYRHFQSWDSTQARATYQAKGNKRKTIKVRVIYCTPNQAIEQEINLTKKHDPRDMQYKYKETKTSSKAEQSYKDTDFSDVPF